MDILSGRIFLEIVFAIPPSSIVCFFLSLLPFDSLYVQGQKIQTIVLQVDFPSRPELVERLVKDKRLSLRYKTLNLKPLFTKCDGLLLGAPSSW